MSGIVGSRLNIRGSGLVGSLGTDGQIFTSSGAGAGAVFEDAAGGGAWNLLSTTTASNDATIDIETNDLDSTYTNYAVVFSDVQPSSDNQTTCVQLSVGGTYATSGYQFCTRGTRSDGVASNDVSESAAHMLLTGLGVGSATGEVTHGVLYIFNPSGTTYTKFIRATSCQIGATAGRVILTSVAGSNMTQTAVDGIRFFPRDDGDVATGTFKLYGIS